VTNQVLSVSYGDAPVEIAERARAKYLAHDLAEAAEAASAVATQADIAAAYTLLCNHLLSRRLHLCCICGLCDGT